MKYLFLAALILAPVAEARETCQNLATTVYEAAKVRDQGMDADDLLKELRGTLDDAAYRFAQVAVAQAYGWPRLTPAQEGNTAYEQCERAK